MEKTGEVKYIVLAEDDSDDIEIFEMALKEMQFPYVIKRVENGNELSISLKDRIPDILFLDINMPYKDGLECVLEIRKYSEYDQMPIVIYSSYLSDHTIEEAYRSGASLFLVKAEIFNELVMKLNKIFSIDWKAYIKITHKITLF